MSFLRWLTRSFTQESTARRVRGRQTGGRRHAPKPMVSLLENRLAPAVLTVNSLLDLPVSAASPTLSLREAITLINSGGAATDASGKSLATAKASEIDTTQPFGTSDTIRFNAGVFTLGQEVVDLNAGPLQIERGATILGPGIYDLALSGHGQNSVLLIEAGAVVGISNLTIENGVGQGSEGGGVTNYGVLTLTDTAITGNTAFNGGGILNNGSLTLVDSKVSGNSALNNGGIVSFGNLTLVNSTISGDSATVGNGGLANYGGRLSITDSTISGNTAVGAGGIGNYDGGTATITDTIISGNSASMCGGGIINQAAMTLDGTTVVGNVTSADNGNSGGILNGGNLTLSGSTVAANTAAYGGGIVNTGSLALQNSTVLQNSAQTGSGGIVTIGGTLALTDSVVSGNAVAKGEGEIGVGGGTVIVTESSFVGNSGDSSDGSAVAGSDQATVVFVAAKAPTSGAAIESDLTAAVDEVFAGIAAQGSAGMIAPTVTDVSISLASVLSDSTAAAATDPGQDVASAPATDATTLDFADMDG